MLHNIITSLVEAIVFGIFIYAIAGIALLFAKWANNDNKGGSKNGR